MDFSTYKKETLEIYNCKGILLEIEDIVFTGDGYDVMFISTGKSNFEAGKIIMCKDSTTDKVVVDKDGNKYIYSLSAMSGLDKEVIKYKFSLYDIGKYIIKGQLFTFDDMC